MQNPIDSYWKIRMTDLKNSLEKNNFEVFIAEKSDDAIKVVLDDIIMSYRF